MSSNSKNLLDPFEERPDSGERHLHLYGLQQQFVRVNEMEKNQKLVDLLEELEFNQVVVFVAEEPPDRAVGLTQFLQDNNFPVYCIHPLQPKEERIDRFQRFRKFEYRILISTRAVGIGMDIEYVDLVFNYDLPDTTNEYLVRVGSAGAYGARGLILSFLSGTVDEKLLADVQVRFRNPVTEYIAANSSSSSSGSSSRNLNER